MEESNSGDADRTVLERNYLSVHGRSIDYYEDARKFFLELEDGRFENTFRRLFLTSHDFDNYSSPMAGHGEN